MSFNKIVDGQSRVVIEKISPEVDGGRYAAKAIVGENIVIEADVFTDSHDLLSTFVKYKHSSEKNWQNVRLEQTVNDRYKASFSPNKIGFYSYQIEAFIDHAATWLHEIESKIKANLNVAVELLVGAELLTHLPIEGKKETDFIKNAISIFKNEKKYSNAFEVIRDVQLHNIIENFPKKDFVSTSPLLKLWVDREKAGFSAWYSMFPRSATNNPGAHGTFKDVEKNVLPKVKKMGFDVLYLPPIHPIGQSFRKGKNNSTTALPGEPGVPYAIGSELGGHTAILPELGTLADFKQLIKACEKQGIEMCMDLAIQCSPDHPYAKDHPNWFKIRPDGSIQYAENPPKKYQDIYPINYESTDWQALWLELKNVVMTWAEWGVKIIRVDNPHTKSFQFWEWIIDEVHQVYPEMIFLAEAFTRPKIMQNLAKVGYTQSYTYYTWRNTKHDLIEYMTELTTSEMKQYSRPNFWPNTHDILPNCLQTGVEAAFLTRYFMAATLSSNYGIFGPTYEYMVKDGMPGKEEYLNSEKYEIGYWDWQKENKLTALISKTNAIRKENKAFHSTNNIVFCDIANDNLIAYLKSDNNGNNVLCVVNLDPYNTQSEWVSVPVHALGKEYDTHYQVIDLITGNEFTWTGEMNYISLDPNNGWPMHCFKII